MSLLGLLCVFCFFFQAANLLKKFLSREATIATSRERDPGLRFPSLVFCPSPGYREEAMRRLGINRQFWDFTSRCSVFEQ